ncbi:MAG: queuosine precursor transporter, partial [Oscillospiraceae bacterium]
NVIYGTVFLATDILSEKHGAKESRKGVWIGFASMLAFVACVQLSLLYTPNSTDFVSASMHTIFDIMPRICVASLVSYLISNLLDTYLYAAIKKVLPSDKWLWVRNNAATWLSQIVDSALFTTLAFAGVFEKGVLLELIFTTYAIKVIVAVFDTPFLYIAKKIKE